MENIKKNTKHSWDKLQIIDIHNIYSVQITKEARKQ